MQYGNFSQDGREFIIDNVATPTPWINYIYNGKYFATVSNNAGGISYVGNPLHGRVTRYRINDVPSDRPGKYIYVRDNDTGEVWSLSWQPVSRDKDSYRVAHGFGYTRIEAEVEDIASEVTYFVPRDADQEIWKALLTNNSDKPRNLSVYGYVEFCLGHAHVDLINQCDDQHFNRLYFDNDLNTLFATKTYWVTQDSGTQQQENKEWNQWAFFTANHPVVQYETMRERFIGNYRSENNPQALETGELSSQDSDYGNSVGALRCDITLDPGESTDVVFSLGVVPKEQFEELAQDRVTRFHEVDESEKALENVHKWWDEYFNANRVATPERETDIFLNYWIPYQARVAFDVGRVCSYYYWGIGRSFGFRDTSQDTIAITQCDPQCAKDRVELLSRQMFSTGKVFHHFVKDGQGETTGHCDDPFWFILAVTDYIKESGDLSILDQEQPYLDGKTGTILDHMIAVTQLAKTAVGKHGLPIFGRGDWNDTLDYIGGDDGGESVWGALFYVCMMNYLLELLEFAGKTEQYNQVAEIRDTMVDNINKYCWDGKWYIRAFGAQDRKIGSSDQDYGKIFLNSQTWAVLAGVADKDRLTQAMDSVYENLDTEFGPKICAPAYPEIDPTVGLITRCVVGKKENGAIFCHPLTWTIMADCMLGRGDRAYHYFKDNLPNAHDQETFCAEPYVYSQYITSDEHSSPGRASHSWQTGTAAWMKKVLLDYVMGVRATYQGLLVDPAIPSHWDHLTIERVFRGCRYNFTIENPAGVQHGVKSIEVNGKQIEGQIIPICAEDSCDVKVIMG